ncbi:MAG TPA: efflux RND transporter periplasmic adaptor subunit [Planctomycetota bacterium]|nr:efflux RND transporter periplasmic adaptor subunit [Planctomycetota bacterium]
MSPRETTGLPTPHAETPPPLVDLRQLRIERDAPSAWKRKRGAPVAWIVFLLLVLGAVAIFWKPLTRAIDDLRLPKVTAVKVQRSSPLAASATSGTAANGYIVAAKRAALSADTPGRIVELNVVEGSVVQKGFVVARLYSDEVRAAVQRAEADLVAANASVDRARAQRDAAAADAARLQAEVARAEAGVQDPKLLRDWYKVELERWRKLAEQDTSAKRTVEETASQLARAEANVLHAETLVTQARAALVQGEAQVKALDAGVVEAGTRIAIVQAERAQALAALDKLEVRAPFDGVVVLKDAEVGEVVSPNSQGGNSRGSVATMVDWASLEVQIELQETSLSAAKVDEPANIFLDAYPSRVYRGTVKRIWPTANRQKATVEVRVGFDEPDDKLRPEMGARVVFGAAQSSTSANAQDAEPVILISRSAVVKENGAQGVFVIERDVARFTQVELGEERGGRVTVKKGLSGDETIVADPPSDLVSGERVRIKE